MRTIIAGGLLSIGLLAGTATLSLASASAQPGHGMDRLTVASHDGNIQQADYYYHHHHYRHRRWDKKHRQWEYY